MSEENVEVVRASFEAWNAGARRRRAQVSAEAKSEQDLGRQGISKPNNGDGQRSRAPIGSVGFGSGRALEA
jgi:hypothetical protein